MNQAQRTKDETHSEQIRICETIIESLLQENKQVNYDNLKQYQPRLRAMIMHFYKSYYEY